MATQKSCSLIVLINNAGHRTLGHQDGQGDTLHVEHPILPLHRAGGHRPGGHGQRGGAAQDPSLPLHVCLAACGCV